MENSTVLECRHIKIFPIFLGLCSLVILWGGFVVGFSINSILGFVFLPLSILMLLRPIILIRPNEIEWKNLLGNTTKTVSFKLDEIEVKDNKIFINGNKVVALWQVDKNANQVKTFLS